MKNKNLKVLNFQNIEKYTYKRKVLIKDLVFKTSIGIHDFEKKKKQQIKFNIEININPFLKPSGNNLDNIVNYEEVISNVKKLTQKRIVIIFEELKEKYNPLKEKQIRIAKQYASQEGIAEAFTKTTRSVKQEELLLTF